ncbi:MAG: SRPBCC family protein [Desulfocapsaceae bacterium]|nr:SRPBCC family protein [Desulfocapsaceae bacterium]
MIAYRKGNICVEKSTGAQLEEVWKVLTDTTLWPLWGPSVSAVESKHRSIRAASSGRVRTALGFWLPFTITSYDELKFWSWKVGGIQATGHRLIRKEDGGCRIIFDMPWWAAPYSLICLLAIGRIIKLVEKNLV